MKNKNNTMKEKYYKMLKDPRWFERREEILNRDGHCCFVCDSKENLNVHHRQYHSINGGPKQPWMYEGKYLITLCKNCHSLVHKLFKIPSFKLSGKSCTGMSIPADEFKRTKQFVKI